MLLGTLGGTTGHTVACAKQMLALSITLLAFNLKIMDPNNMAFGPQKMQKYGSKYSLQLAFCLGLTITITWRICSQLTR